MTQYFSKFGGLWIDDTNVDRVTARTDAISDAPTRDAVRNFTRDGYVVLRNAVPLPVIDTYLAQYEAAAAAGTLRVEVPTDGGYQDFDRAKTLRPGSKVLDTAMLLPAGQKISFAPAISRFLQSVFCEKALAFQSLHFEVGSRQAMHQDTAYVVVDKEPMELVASWVALEDIRPGSGELVYYPGGHRMAEYCYADGACKHFDPKRDGGPAHQRHLRYLHQEAARTGLAKQHFFARKGDVLLWHADLPHGGAVITKPELTRRALVTHYCPRSLTPHYVHWIPKPWRLKTETRDGNAFISMFYPPERFAARSD